MAKSKGRTEKGLATSKRRVTDSPDIPRAVKKVKLNVQKRGGRQGRSSVEADRIAIRALSNRVVESKGQLKEPDLQQVLRLAKRSGAQRAGISAGAKVVVQLTRSPNEFKGIKEALKYFDFQTDRYRRKGAATIRPFTIDTAKNAEALGGLVRVVYLPPTVLQSGRRSIERMNTLESYGDKYISHETFMGERLELEGSGFISVERGLGVTTLAWSTPLPLADVLRLLEAGESGDSQGIVRVSRLDASGVQAPPSSETLQALLEEPENIVYAAVPCPDYTFIWKASPKTLQRAGGLAEIALVYDIETVGDERHYVRDLGSFAMEQAFISLASKSKILGG